VVCEGALLITKVDLESHLLISGCQFPVISRLAHSKAQITAANNDQLRALLLQPFVITLNLRIDRLKPYGAKTHHTLVVPTAKSAYFHFVRVTSNNIVCACGHLTSTSNI